MRRYSNVFPSNLHWFLFRFGGHEVDVVGEARCVIKLLIFDLVWPDEHVIFVYFVSGHLLSFSLLFECLFLKFVGVLGSGDIGLVFGVFQLIIIHDDFVVFALPLFTLIIIFSMLSSI